jgi:hypothetical protein
MFHLDKREVVVCRSKEEEEKRSEDLTQSSQRALRALRRGEKEEERPASEGVRYKGKRDWRRAGRARREKPKHTG